MESIQLGMEHKLEMGTRTWQAGLGMESVQTTWNEDSTCSVPGVAVVFYGFVQEGKPYLRVHHWP